MRISLSTATFYHRSVSYSLRAARAAGCDGVELVLGLGYLLFGLEPLERAVARTGVPILSVHPPLRSPPGWPRTMSASMSRLITACQRLGASVCVVHPGMYSRETSPRAQDYTVALARGQQRAGESPRIAIENNQVTGRHHHWLLDELPALARFAERGGYGITLDTCHIGANREDLFAAYELVRPLLRNVHLSDMRWRDGQPQTHLLPGEGTLPLKEFLGRLAEDGYDGPITLELHPLAVGLIGWERTVGRVAQAVAYVRDAVGSSLRPPAGV